MVRNMVSELTNTNLLDKLLLLEHIGLYWETLPNLFVR